VFVNIVHVGVGPVSEHDIDLAQACRAYIVGFNVRNPPSAITQGATQANIKVPCLLFLQCLYFILLSASLVEIK
jgi:translation initiation factor IF-2